MKSTRKQFLSTAASGLAAAALGFPHAAFGKLREEGLLPSTFGPLVGSIFRVAGVGGAGDSDLTLVDVRDHTPAPVKGVPSATVQFTLLFSSQGGAPIPQGTYRVRHSTLDELNLFLQPAGSAVGSSTLYRAEFNLLRERKSGTHR